jgi:hypothetical protein
MTNTQLHELGNRVIGEVHSLWERNRDRYPAGYEVFYGPLRFKPSLLLVGMNPGGGKESARQDIEKLSPDDSPMEYITKTGKDGYELAKRTVPVFKNIGHLEALSKSVKTNMNFFRSKEDELLPKEDAAFCRAHVIHLIQTLQPIILFCEAIAVFDVIHDTLFAKKTLKPSQEYLRGGYRKYVSLTCEEPNMPRLLIGITHMTGKIRPTSEDMVEIGAKLKIDLDKCLEEKS